MAAKVAAKGSLGRHGTLISDRTRVADATGRAQEPANQLRVGAGEREMETGQGKRERGKGKGDGSLRGGGS
jgi:hypothetical protein